MWRPLRKAKIDVDNDNNKSPFVRTWGTPSSVRNRADPIRHLDLARLFCRLLLLVWGAYVYLLGVLGFYLSTYLMPAVSMYCLLGIRRRLPLALRPALLLLVVYLLLQIALNVRLPEAYWQ